MPIYHYVAIDPTNNRNSEGRLQARSFREAKEIIRNQGQIPTKLEEEAGMGNLQQLLTELPLISYFTNPSLRDLAVFTQQLYTLLDAGIPLIEGLFLLEQATSNEMFREVLKKVRADVIAGDSFSTAIKRYPKIFNQLYINMIRAGEVSGTLDHICRRLGVLIEKEIAMKAKITGAMVMPGISAVIIFAVTAGLLIWVVPQFQMFFQMGGQELPLPTKMLIFASDFLKAFWWGLLLAMGGFIAWFNVFRQSKVGKPLVDQWMLTMPVLGSLLNKAYASSFVRTLATLQASGVSLTEGIATAAGTVNNYVISVILDRARESILTGGTLSKPMEHSKVFPFMVTKMIAIGEETGNLENMLLKSSDYLDHEVDEAIENMTKLIQPAMTVILGGILLFILLGLYIPIFDMHKVVGH